MGALVAAQILLSERKPKQKLVASVRVNVEFWKGSRQFSLAVQTL